MKLSCVEEDAAEFKRWLRNHREAQKMPQIAAAEALGVDEKTIKNLENPKKGFAHGLTLLRYLRLLELLRDAPEDQASPFARLEARVEQTRLLVAEGFGLQDRARELEVELRRLPEGPPASLEDVP